MASLVVLLIICGFAAYYFFKGTFVKSFAMFMTALFAAFAAFAYFEPLADVLIKRKSLVGWAQSLCFGGIFVGAFVLLQVGVWFSTRRPSNLGQMPERIGRPVFGVLSGFVVAGVLLVALAAAPLSNNLPYRRFDAKALNPDRPAKPLLNADGFTTSIFALVSRGSLSGQQSFAVFHPNFLDQMFLNRLAEKKASAIIRGTALLLPKKTGVWQAPAGIKDSQTQQALAPSSGHNLAVVRIGISKSGLKDASLFTASQLRLVCSRNPEKPLSGAGRTVYPLGYIKTAETVKTLKLTDQIKLQAQDFTGTVKYIDFIFEVPAGYTPALVELKQNNVAKVSAFVSAGNAPPSIPFIPQADCTTAAVGLEPVPSAKLYGLRLGAANKLFADSQFRVSSPAQLTKNQTDDSITKAELKKYLITRVRAEIKPPEAVEEDVAKKSVAALLKPLKGYQLLALKCNNPTTGESVTAQQLPVLLEANGKRHHAAGVIAAGNLGDETIWELDYTSVKTTDDTEGLVIAKDGTVAEPFPPAVWLTEKTQSISEFYVLYLIAKGKGKIITSVQPGGTQTHARLEKFDGFIVK